MSKNPARLDDEHDCAIKPHGKGKVVTADDTVLFQGKPVAREGDTVKCHDGSETKIKEGQGCVVVNGKRVALVGDKTEHDGEITSGADGIHVDEGKPFVFIGPNVRIGGNVSFKVRKAPTSAPQPTTTGASQDTNAAAAANSAVAEENLPNMWPSAEVKIAHMGASLAEIHATGMAAYEVSISNSLEATLKVSNKNSVNPITFDKEGFQIEAKNEAIKVLSHFKVRNIGTAFINPPTITVYNDQGEYTFELTSIVQTPYERQLTGNLRKEVAMDDNEWVIAGEVNMTLTVNMKMRPPGSSWETSLKEEIDLIFKTEPAPVAWVLVVLLAAFAPKPVPPFI